MDTDTTIKVSNGQEKKGTAAKASAAAKLKKTSAKPKVPNEKKRKRFIDEDDEEFEPGEEREDDFVVDDDDALLEDENDDAVDLDGMDVDEEEEEVKKPSKTKPSKKKMKTIEFDSDAMVASFGASPMGAVKPIKRSDGPNMSGETILEKMERAMETVNEERHAAFSERLVLSVERMRDRMSAYQGEEVGDEEAGEDGEEEEEEKPKSKKGAAPKKGGIKYTPLELQYLEIRKAYPDTVLFVESGYRYKFFGEDAKIASKILNIRVGVSNNFLATSVPVHRLHVHALRLVQAGYKVGVVSQTETAALKAISSNKTGPFKRAVSALYTKSTLVTESMDPLASDSASYGQYLMAIFETSVHNAQIVDGVRLHIVAVKTSTGDIIYDSFDDTAMRTELETRLKHISPIELILSENTSAHTKKMIEHYTTTSTSKEELPRVEYMKANAFDLKLARELIADELALFAENLETEKAGDLGKTLKTRADHFFETLDSNLKICFGALAFYLKDFGISSLICLSCNFNTFSNRRHMVIDGNALANLELLSNQQTFTKEGSLFSVIDRTSTSFGRRRLMQWLRQPLMVKEEIEARLDAVEELSRVGSVSMSASVITSPAKQGPYVSNPNRNGLARLLTLLVQLPDLERGICRIFSNRCSVTEFMSVLVAFRHIEQCMPKPDEIDHCVQAPLLKEILKSIPHNLADHVSYFLDPLNLESSDPQKRDLFRDDSRFPELQEIKSKLKATESELDDHLLEIRSVLGKPRLEYVKKNKDEYVIEVTKAEGAKAPKNWTSLAGPKTQARFHTPFIIEKYQELLQHRERMSIETTNAWAVFVKEFASRYTVFRNTVDALATLDCLHSFSMLAKTDGYVKPEILASARADSNETSKNGDSGLVDEADEAEITIINGRHPVVEALLMSTSGGAVFVPNDTKLGVLAHGERSVIITGPNMGGKTCYTRQVATLCIMAQMGCYVPAESMRLNPLDLIATRMGAYDNAFKGQSTFFVELQETSDILRSATPRSLVILDELGRGTSTHDGFAIAYATLHHLLTKNRCFTLFVTHYPGLSQLTRLYPKLVQNHHISYLEEERPSSDEIHKHHSGKDAQESHATPKITLLHKLVHGVEGRSFGMNVARLANLPPTVVNHAAAKSNALEAQVKQRYNRSALTKLYQLSKTAPQNQKLKLDAHSLQITLSSKL
jgi:DNA mismatch repair protein MSH3